MPKGLPIYFEDFKEGDYAEFGSYKVTREEVIEFASKYDPQPFHLEDEAAKASIFGKLAASGWHTCAMSMRMVVDHMKETGTSALGGAGIDDLKWHVPVYPGDILRNRVTYGTKTPHPRRPFGFVKLGYQVLNQNDIITTSYTANVMFSLRPE